MKIIIIRPEGPAKKIILLRFCLKKNILAQTRNPSPPPPLEYQMDRGLQTYSPSHIVQTTEFL